MKSFFTFICCICLSCLLMVGCQKNIDSFVADPALSKPDTIWQNIVPSNAAVIALKNELRTPKVNDSFSYSNTGIVFSSGALSLGIPPNALVKSNGNIPTGNINREYLLMQKKGDFIAAGLSTTSNGSLLISGGAFFTSLKNNGEDLQVSPGNKLTVKYNSSVTSSDNKIFNLATDVFGNNNWIPNQDTAFNKSLLTQNGYEIQTNKLQYVQTARLLDTTGVLQTLLTVKLPVNYTNTNTIAYLCFNSIDCVAGFTPDVAARSFVSPQLPVNKAVTIIIISKQGGDYYLGSQQTITSLATSGSPNQEVIVTPVKKSLEFIKSYLTSL